jgi:hypothetical protein
MTSFDHTSHMKQPDTREVTPHTSTIGLPDSYFHHLHLPSWTKIAMLAPFLLVLLSISGKYKRRCGNTPDTTSTAATAYHPAASILITTLADSAGDGLTRLFGQDQRPDIAHIPNSQSRNPRTCVYLIPQHKMWPITSPRNTVRPTSNTLNSSL